MIEHGQKEHWAISLLKENTITLLLLSISTLFTLLNIYSTSKLAPIVKDLESVSGRVSAIETDRSENRGLIERFYHMETTVQNIKEQVDKIDRKLDIAIQK